jgi:hypothetical protein
LSLKGLELTRQISLLVRKSLEAKGIWRLNDIDGMELKNSALQLLRYALRKKP